MQHEQIEENNQVHVFMVDPDPSSNDHRNLTKEKGNVSHRFVPDTKIMGRDQETEEEKGVSIMRLW